eukprot:863137-Amorphochlora_amoeboformis.AAC.1
MQVTWGAHIDSKLKYLRTDTSWRSLKIPEILRDRHIRRYLVVPGDPRKYPVVTGPQGGVTKHDITRCQGDNHREYPSVTQ